MKVRSLKLLQVVDAGFTHLTSIGHFVNLIPFYRNQDWINLNHHENKTLDDKDFDDFRSQESILKPPNSHYFFNAFVLVVDALINYIFRKHIVKRLVPLIYFEVISP